MLLIYNLKNTITIQEIKEILTPIYETDESLEDIYDRFINIKSKQTQQLEPLVKNIIESYQLDINDKNERLITIMVLSALANQLTNIIEGIIDSFYKEF